MNAMSTTAIVAPVHDYYTINTTEHIFHTEPSHFHDLWPYLNNLKNTSGAYSKLNGHYDQLTLSMSKFNA